MLTKTKSHIRIPRRQWEKLKKNPNFADMIELLEDQADLEAAKQVRGRDLSLDEYLKKRGIRSRT
jgi:hypothetical protein